MNRYMIRKLAVVIMCRIVRDGKVISKSFMGLMESRVRKRIRIRMES